MDIVVKKCLKQLSMMILGAMAILIKQNFTVLPSVFSFIKKYFFTHWVAN